MKAKLLLIRILRRFTSSSPTHARLSTCALRLALGDAVSLRQLLGLSPLTDPLPSHLKLGSDWVQHAETGRVVWVGSKDSDIRDASMRGDAFITLLD